MPRLVSARWCNNHGVILTYSSNGASGPTRFVPPHGALTVGEVSKLLNIYPLQVYRLVSRRVFHFKDHGGVATVPLADIRDYQANGAGPATRGDST
jgi:hypothetical protein